jgi:uncharacterized OB-fold protein
MPINLEKDQDIYVTRGMVRAEFDFWVGEPADKFFAALEKQKLIANKCEKCGTVFLPPRKVCGDCFVKISKYVTLSNSGMLKNFTITPYKISERRKRKSRSKTIVGLIQIKGADTAIALPIVEAEPDDLEIGMKMQIVWKEKPTGQPLDIEGVRPIGGD